MIETKSISEQITEILKQKILHHEFKPGEKIDTDKLAQEYEVSAMPVRDALKKLENRGLVINRERVGFFVRELSIEEINEIVEVRLMYEGYCLQKHLDNIDLSRVRALLEEMRSFKNSSRQKFDKIDKKLHYSIIRASENEFLVQRYKNIEDLVDLVRHLDKDREEKAMEEHIEITKRILSKKTLEARKLLEDHIKNVRKNIINQYKNTTGGG